MNSRRMGSLVAGVWAILAPAAAYAKVEPFPPAFRSQLVDTNGTKLFVRVGGSGPAVVMFGLYTLAQVKTFLRWCAEKGFVSASPAESVKPKGEPIHGNAQLRVDEVRRRLAKARVAFEGAEELA